jgi:putative SOS response-associated peptidase YedK
MGAHSLLVQGSNRRAQAHHAKCETVGTLPTFRDAHRLRRCMLPVDGFYEWKAVKGQRAKQPYAIAMKDGSPFGIAGLWENWKDRLLVSGSGHSR